MPSNIELSGARTEIFKVYIKFLAVSICFWTELELGLKEALDVSVMAIFI